MFIYLFISWITLFTPRKSKTKLLNLILQSQIWDVIFKATFHDTWLFSSFTYVLWCLLQLQECRSFKGFASCLQVGVLVSGWRHGLALGLRLHGSLSRMQRLHSADQHWFEKKKKKSKLLAKKHLVMGSNLLPCKWIYDSVCPSNTTSFVTCKWCVQKFVLFVCVGPSASVVCGC